jgi:hypothetical protein
MNIPLQPEPSPSSKQPMGDSVPQAGDLLSQAASDTLAAQRAALQNLPTEATPRKVASLLSQHEQQLYAALDRDPTTQNLPENVKQQFVLEQVAQQRQEFLDPMQTVSKSFKKMAQIKNEALAPSLGSNPPATEKTLDIDGVSVYEWHAPNGQILYIPVGHSLQGSTTTPSEAWGYAMRNAVEAGDKGFFQQLTQSYLYFCNQSIGTNQTQLFGLMGWNPDMTTGSYANQSAATSASDADEDIINALIAGYQKFGDMTITDPVTPPGTPNTHTSISLHDLTLDACESFIKGDIGSFTINGKTYSPVMTNDEWGHDALNPDYFDPTTFSNMINFLNANNGSGQYTQDIATVKSAAQNTMQFIFDVAQASGGWIPDGPYNIPAQPNNFGYDATRILMRLGQFIATPGASSLFGDTTYNQAVTVLKNLVANIMPDVNSQGQFPPSGLNGGCFTGPLLTALAALNKIGQLPASVHASSIQTVLGYFQNDMENYDISDGVSGWQNNGYFNIELGVLSESIMKDLGIYPGS